MDKMTDGEIIQVVSDHSNGLQIQYINIGFSKEWKDCTENKPTWNFNDVVYRSLPKPIEGWVGMYPNKEMTGLFSTMEEAKDECPSAHDYIYMKQIVKPD